MDIKHYFLMLEVLAFAAGLLAFMKMRHIHLRSLVVLLGITILNEWLMVPWATETKFLPRMAIYNLFSLLEMWVWFFLFYKTASSFNKRTILIVACMGFAAAMVEMLLSPLAHFRVYSFRLYNLLMIFLAVGYYLYIQRKEYYNIFTEPVFFIVSAAFIYHLLLFVNATTFVDNSYWKIPNSYSIFKVLHGIGNSFYYFSLCAAFLMFLFQRNPQPSWQPR